MPAPLRCPAVTIAAGATGLSGVVYIGPNDIVGYQIGANWQAADISMQASVDGTTFGEVSDSAAAALDLKAAANGYYYLATPLRIGPYIKIRSGASGAAVNQTSGAVVTLVLQARAGLANE